MIAAALACAAARFTRLPLVPLYLLAGWLIALSGVEAPADFASEALQLGVAVLVFLAGAELNPQRLGGDRRLAALLTLWPLILTGAASFLWLQATGVATVPSIYLACALAGSSTIVAVRQLRHLRQTREPFGRLVTAVQLLQDFLLVGLLVLLSAWPGGWLPSLLALAKSGVLLAAAFGLQLKVIPWLLTKARPGEETLLMIMLAMLFAFGGAARLLELPLVVGAFLAGFAISRFPTNGLLRVQLAGLGDFFFAIFFITLGYVAGLPHPGQLLTALGLAAIVVILRPLVVTLLARASDMSARPALETGLLLGQASEIGLVIGLLGLGAGHLQLADFSLLALVAAFTMMLTPLVATDGMTSWLLHHLPRRRPPAPGSLRRHVLMLGYGAAGRWILKGLQEHDLSVFVIDDDPAVIAHLESNNIPCLRADGSDPYTLAAVGADRARVVLCSMRRTADAAKVLRELRGQVPVVARVFEKAEADTIRRLGGIPVLNSEAAAARFLEWLQTSGGLCPANR
jgi:CPA2 family monovalent cation:H+ antiporter-2